MTKKYFSTYYKCDGEYFHKTFRVEEDQIKEEKYEEGENICLRGTFELTQENSIFTLERLVSFFTTHLRKQKRKDCEIIKCIYSNDEPKTNDNNNVIIELKKNIIC